MIFKNGETYLCPYTQVKKIYINGHFNVSCGINSNKEVHKTLMDLKSDSIQKASLILKGI